MRVIEKVETKKNKIRKQDARKETPIKWSKELPKFTFFLMTVGLLVLRLVYPQLKIDEITIALLAIALLPWLPPIVKSLKFPGGEVNFREMESKVENIVQEATATVEDLRELALPLVATMYQNLAWGGRFGQSITEDEQVEIAHALDRVCERLSIEDERIQRWKDEMFALHGIDRLRTIISLLKAAKVDETIIAQLSSALNSSGFPKVADLMSGSQIEEILKPLEGALTPEISKKVTEYVSYYEECSKEKA